MVGGKRETSHPHFVAEVQSTSSIIILAQGDFFLVRKDLIDIVEVTAVGYEQSSAALLSSYLY